MRRCIESRGGVPFFVCGNRQSFQDDLLGGLKKINTTAAKTFDQQLSSNERNTIQLNKQILELADEHAGLKAQLHEDLPPDRKRAVERRIQSVQKKAFKAQRDFKKSAAKVKNPTRLDGLVGDVDLKQFGFDSATVVDAKEARTRAAGVQFISDVKTRKVHGIYVDSDGNALRGPDNRRNGRWRATNGTNTGAGPALRSITRTGTRPGPNSNVSKSFPPASRKTHRASLQAKVPSSRPAPARRR